MRVVELADRVRRKGIGYAMRMLPCQSTLADEVINHLSRAGYESTDKLRAGMEAWRNSRKARAETLELERAVREKEIELRAQQEKARKAQFEDKIKSLREKSPVKLANYMATLAPADYKGIATLAERKAAKARRERIAQRKLANEQREWALAKSFGYESRNVSVAGLKARGWTDGLIREFLGKPDELADNPHYKCAGPMRLYRVRRVLKATRSRDWQIRMRQRLFPPSIHYVWEQIDRAEANMSPMSTLNHRSPRSTVNRVGDGTRDCT